MTKAERIEGELRRLRPAGGAPSLATFSSASLTAEFDACQRLTTAVDDLSTISRSAGGSPWIGDLEAARDLEEDFSPWCGDELDADG